jgi:hypothetical protein
VVSAGASAFSEPEAIALRDYVAKISPRVGRLLAQQGEQCLRFGVRRGRPARDPDSDDCLRQSRRVRSGAKF